LEADPVLLVEYRTHLWQLDPLEIQEKYLSANQSPGSDDLLILAVESAPPAMQVIRPEVIAEAQEMRAESGSPETASKARQLRQMRNTLESEIRSFEQELDEYSPPDDMLRTIAAEGLQQQAH
jgi:hypothetical protein